MNTKQTTDHDMTDYQPEMNPLMAAYNPVPPQVEGPAQFYWQTWQDAAPGAMSSDEAVQEAFEN